MLEKYKKRTNLIIGLTIAFPVVLWIINEVFKVDLPLEVYVVSFVLVFGIYLLGSWNYAKGKGYPGILGIVVAPFNLLGLLILMVLRDKNPEYINTEGKVKPLSRKISTPLVIIIFILIILITVAILSWQGLSW